GGIIRRKKTIAPDTAPRLMQRKNSCFRPVNMLTGCPGIFSVFIFIIQFVVRKKC
ncbi:HNH endonuclease, partial [Escherichia coli]